MCQAGVTPMNRLRKYDNSHEGAVLVLQAKLTGNLIIMTPYLEAVHVSVLSNPI